MLTRKQQVISTILYKYKYGNISLEASVKSLLSLYNLPHISLDKVEYESILRELADIFVSYKFRKKLCTKFEFIVLLEEFVKNNKDFLSGDNFYLEEDWLDLLRN